jgi:hypothetical protein
VTQLGLGFGLAWQDGLRPRSTGGDLNADTPFKFVQRASVGSTEVAGKSLAARCVVYGGHLRRANGDDFDTPGPTAPGRTRGACEATIGRPVVRLAVGAVGDVGAECGFRVRSSGPDPSGPRSSEVVRTRFTFSGPDPFDRPRSHAGRGPLRGVSAPTGRPGAPGQPSGRRPDRRGARRRYRRHRPGPRRSPTRSPGPGRPAPVGRNEIAGGKAPVNPSYSFSVWIYNVTII